MKIKALAGASAACALAAITVAAPARADVKQAAPDGLVIQIKGEVDLPRQAAWTRLVAVGSWWSDAHSYSGNAKAITVDVVAGGCWCEIWEGGEVEHGRVMYVSQGQTIRFDAPLGPLQELGVATSLTFTLANGSVDGRTAVTLDYTVTGSSLSGLDKLAPVINQVLTEAVKRYATLPAS
jgi:hypothetical protein